MDTIALNNLKTVVIQLFTVSDLIACLRNKRLCVIDDDGKSKESGNRGLYVCGCTLLQHFIKLTC